MDALKILSRVTEGLSYCHDQKVAHRDLKVGSIFYTEDNLIKLGSFLLDLKTPKLLVKNPAKRRTDIGTPLYMAPEQLKALKLVKGESKYEVGAFDDLKADAWALGLLIWDVLTFTCPVHGETLEDMINLANAGAAVAELPNVMGFDEATYAAFKEITSGLLMTDPAKRWAVKQAHTKLQALCKAQNIANPAPSPEYTEADFQPFFAYIAKKQGKPEAQLFEKHKALLKMLGAIPIALKKKVDLKTLPFHDEITDKKGVKFMYQGTLGEDGQPKGLGAKWNEKQFEFGVYNEEPFSITKLKVELNEITIIPNSKKPMKTKANLNGVTVQGYGHVYGKMSFPDGRYFEGGFEKDGDFKGVGKYLFSNGDFYHGEWAQSKINGLGKLFSKAAGKWIYGTFSNQAVGINPKDLHDLDKDTAIKAAKEHKPEEWTNAIKDKGLDVYFF